MDYVALLKKENMMTKKKILSWLGKLLMIAALIFIAVRLMRYNVDFSILTSPLTIAGLLINTIVLGLGVFLFAFNFVWLIRVLSGVAVERNPIVVVYCATNLYKYLPGNVLQFIGRNRIAFDTKGVNHSHVAFATVLEIVFFCLAAVLLASIFAFEYFISAIRMMHAPPLVFALIFLLALVSVAVLFAFRERMIALLKKHMKPNFHLKEMAILLGNCSLRLVIMAGAYLLTLVLFGQPLAAYLAFRIIGLFVLSWVIGFVVPGAPGGLGIREAIMLMFMSDMIDEGILVSSAVVYRVICIAGDVFAYLLAVVYTHETIHSP